MNTRQLSAALLAFFTIFTAARLACAQEMDRIYSIGKVSYISGGIGSDSRDAFAAREKEFNLKLVSTIAGAGAFVSEVALTITDSAGVSVIQHTTEGPLFLAKLPDGAYTVSARFRDSTQTRKFQVRANRLHTEYLRWPAGANDDVTMPRDKP